MSRLIAPATIDENSTFGQRLAWAMKRSGWRIYTLADALEVDASSVSMYVRGKRLPGFSKMRHICVLLQVSSDFLFGFTQDARPWLERDAS